MADEEIIKEIMSGKKDLRGADLRGAYLIGANFDGANFDGANFDGVVGFKVKE